MINGLRLISQIPYEPTRENAAGDGLRRDDSARTDTESRSRSRWPKIAVVGALTLGTAAAAADTATAGSNGHHHHRRSEPVLLAEGLDAQTGAGSTIGPDGHIYVAEGHAGRVSRVDADTGEISTFASGLPSALLPLGGPMDVAFVDDTPYVLVTMVGEDVGGSDVAGIYRIDGPETWTVIADIGAWSIANPSDSEVFIPSGVHYAMHPIRGGFLVTDGHHNRVLRVAHDGEVSEALTLGNVVPTGLDVRGHKVDLALAGPNPHLPADGEVIRFSTKREGTRNVASGARLIVDVERHRGAVFGLSQGFFAPGNDDGAPAEPDTGALMRADRNGHFRVVAGELDRPTSFEMIGNSAYVVTLDGEIWRIDHVGHRHRRGHHWR